MWFIIVPTVLVVAGLIGWAFWKQTRPAKEAAPESPKSDKDKGDDKKKDDSKKEKAKGTPWMAIAFVFCSLTGSATFIWVYKDAKELAVYGPQPHFEAVEGFPVTKAHVDLETVWKDAADAARLGRPYAVTVTPHSWTPVKLPVGVNYILDPQAAVHMYLPKSGRASFIDAPGMKNEWPRKNPKWVLIRSATEGDVPVVLLIK